jgi:hypothetical protein
VDVGAMDPAMMMKQVQPTIIVYQLVNGSSKTRYQRIVVANNFVREYCAPK